jgi:hypothetical protein
VDKNVENFFPHWKNWGKWGKINISSGVIPIKNGVKCLIYKKKSHLYLFSLHVGNRVFPMRKVIGLLGKEGLNSKKIVLCYNQVEWRNSDVQTVNHGHGGNLPDRLSDDTDSLS